MSKVAQVAKLQRSIGFSNERPSEPKPTKEKPTDLGNENLHNSLFWDIASGNDSGAYCFATRQEVSFGR